jgi:hypothetical protein
MKIDTTIIFFDTRSESMSQVQIMRWRHTEDNADLQPAHTNHVHQQNTTRTKVIHRHRHQDVETARLTHDESLNIVGHHSVHFYPEYLTNEAEYLQVAHAVTRVVSSWTNRMNELSHQQGDIGTPSRSEFVIRPLVWRFRHNTMKVMSDVAEYYRRLNMFDRFIHRFFDNTDSPEQNFFFRRTQSGIPHPNRLTQYRRQSRQNAQCPNSREVSPEFKDAH